LDNGAEGRARLVHDREVEVGVIEEVKEARPNRELSALPLRYAKSLLYREIGIEVGGTAVLVPPLVAVACGWVGPIGLGHTRIAHNRRRRSAIGGSSCLLREDVLQVGGGSKVRVLQGTGVRGTIGCEG